MRKVAHCVDSIITQYYYFIIVMWRKGKMIEGPSHNQSESDDDGEGSSS